MNLILAITLIFIALINLFSIRRKIGRLDIFNQVEHKKNNTILNLLNQSQDLDNVILLKRISSAIVSYIQQSYYVLLGGVDTSGRLKLFGLVFFGGLAGVILNYLYLGADQITIFPLSLFVTTVAILIYKKRKLKKEFYDRFPEVINIINGVISSGGAITVGINEASKRVEGHIGDVMRDISARLEIGENPNNVFMASYLKRLRFPEYYFFILTLMVNLEGGGELREILSRLGRMLANNRLLVKTRDSKTAELRMTMTILTIMPFGFILMLKFISKDTYEILMDTDAGNLILYYVIGSVGFGVYLIKSMINKVI